MKYTITILKLISCIALFGKMPDQKFRIWKNSLGNEINAKLLSVNSETKFSIELENGRKSIVNSKFFCQNDQEFIRWMYRTNQGLKYKYLDPFNLDNEKVRRYREKNRALFLTANKNPPDYCVCPATRILMKDTNIYDYDCVLEQRLKRWLDVMPYSGDNYLKLCVFRENTGSGPMTSENFDLMILRPKYIGTSFLARNKGRVFHTGRGIPQYHTIYIKLRENETVKDLSYLRNFSNLFSIQIENCHVEDLSPLNDLKYLTELCLDNNLITDINILSKNENLWNASVAYNNIDALHNMSDFRDTRLKYLNISHNPLISSRIFGFHLRSWSNKFWENEKRCGTLKNYGTMWTDGIDLYNQCTILKESLPVALSGGGQHYFHNNKAINIRALPKTFIFSHHSVFAGMRKHLYN
tara:strand:+ start:12458 stop:13690 length:1233 start_codon:yes stop_codon:yes gene_type:complete